jgi:hypothetical protein
MYLIDSFESYESVAGMQRRWDRQLQPANISLLNPGVRLTGSAVTYLGTSTHRTFKRLHMGFHFKVVQHHGGASNLSFLHVCFGDPNGSLTNSQNQVGLGVNSSLQVLAFRGDNISGLGGTTLETSSPVLTLGQLHYLEFDLLVDHTGGSLELRVDGTTFLSQSGIDTSDETRDDWNHVQLAAGNVGGNFNIFEFYNLYIEPTLPAAAATFRGEHYVKHLSATGDSAVAFVPQSGSDNYAMVPSPNSAPTTAYVKTSTTGDEDLYTHEQMAEEVDSIAAVQVKTVQLVDSSTGRKALQPRISVGGTRHPEADARLALTTMHEWWSVFQNAPSGSDWTRDAVNSSLIGFGVLPWVKGWNFRSTTPGTDPAHCTYAIAADIYPTTRNGVTFGWDTTAATHTNGGGFGDIRIGGGRAGVNNDGTRRTWLVDLPSAGWYQVRANFGQQGGLVTQNQQYFEIYDGSTLVATLDNTDGTGAREYSDTGTPLTEPCFGQLSPAEEVASESYPRWINFSGTQLKIRLGTPTNVDVAEQSEIAHLEIMSLEPGGAATAAPEMRVSSVSMEVLYAPGQSEVEFDSAEDGSTIGLSWREIYHKDGSGNLATYVDAPVDLNDDEDYYGGYKGPRIKAWGDIIRALSDYRGEYEASETNWIETDTDRRTRGWLGNLTQKNVLNKQVIIRMIDDASRRLELRPRILFRGIIRGFKPKGPLLWEWRAQDFLASLLGSANLQKQIPQEAITRAQFAAAPPEAIGKPVPIIYGEVADGVSSTLPPVINGVASEGFGKDGGIYPILGFGNLTADCSAPSNVTVTAGAGGSGSLPLTYNNQWGAMVTAVDASGNETDASPFHSFVDYGGTRGGFTGSPVPFDTIDGTQAIDVAWTAATGSVSKYRVYFGYWYYGFRPARYVEVTAPTTSVSILTENDGSPILNNQFWYYTVSAVVADGETAMATPEAFGGVFYRRPIRMDWDAVSGATAYIVRRRGAGGTWDREWTVPGTQTYFDDDLLDTGVTYIEGAPAPSGAVPVTYVGLENDAFGFPWYAFLVCGHQVKSIDAVFQNGTKIDSAIYGITLLVPGQTGYGTYFTSHTGSPQYQTVNGRIYTKIYARGPIADDAVNNGKPFTINVKGRCDALDGEMISALALIYKDFVINFGFQDSGGAHLTAPTWPLDLDGTELAQVDEASFDALKTVHDGRLEGGYPGGIVFGAEGEFVNLREAIARMNLSNDCNSGQNRNSQFFVTALDNTIAVLDAAREYTQVHDIVKDTFDIESQSDIIENNVVYSYKRRYAKIEGKGDWDAEEQEATDEAAIEDLGEERRSKTLELWGVRSGSVASDIANRRLLYFKDPPNEVQLLTNLRGLSSELGDVIKVSHTDGLSTTGWTNRPLRIIRHVTNPQNYSVKFVAVDVERLFAGTFTLGDETALAATWGSAATADRLYGYLCDEVTGLFGDGSAGKRLR